MNTPHATPWIDPVVKPALVQLPRSGSPWPRRAFLRMARLHASWKWRRTFAKFGSNSELDRPAFIAGAQSIVIGSGVRIWWGARLEAIASREGHVALRIGDGTVIHPYVHIGAMVGVAIGQGVLMASRVYITDHDHDFSNPDEPPVSNRRLCVAPVTIGDFAWLGEGAMVLKGVTVGEHSVVGAGSVVTRPVPAYSVVVGSPARIVRRYDQVRGEWTKV